MDGPPAVQVLAEEPAVPGRAGHEAPTMSDAPVIPFKPLEDEVPAPSADRPIKEDPAVMAPPRIQALADEPAVIDPAARQPIPITDLPVVPLKPLHDQPPPGPEALHREVEPAFPIAPPSIGILGDEPAASPAERPGARSSARFEAFWRDRRTVAALGLAGRLGTFLSRCLDPINRLERGQPPLVLEERSKPLAEPPLRELSPSTHSVHWSPEIRPLAEEPTSFDEKPQPPSTDDSLPIIPFKTDDDPIVARSATRARDLFVRAAGWVEGLKERVARLAHRERPQPSISSEDLAAPPAPPPHPVEPAPREAPQPPPAISELPALRLAAPDEPREQEDVYDGDEGEDIASLAWLWTKRLAWATALVVIGVFAAKNRDIWLPPAAEIGERTLTEIDERVRDGHFAEQQRLAVEEVARELPYLAPGTIRLIMSRSPIRVLDAPSVFEIAGDATDRGLPTLTADEAEELGILQRELLATLRPEERERIRALDRARDIGAAFPFDTRQGLRLHARGARRLPPESRERLQELFGQAIAAGLGHRAEPATTASAD
jgi:hypothetical protein